MNSKRGDFGVTILTLFSTIGIIILLLLFVFGASFVKKLDKVEGDVSVMDEESVDIGDVGGYANWYSEFYKVKFLHSGGVLFKDLDWSYNYRLGKSEYSFSDGSKK